MTITDPINGKYKGKDIISLDQFSPNDIELLFSFVPKMKDIAKHAKASDILKGTITSLLFYEPSSRTFGSFSAAIKQLGGQTIEIINPQEFSSVSKGETLSDTIKVFESYGDAIVIRHKEVGTAVKASLAATKVPIINAGDGIGEHPTQALLDLYTIYESHKRLQDLIGVFGGDMLNGRTVHSLLRGLALFPGNTMYLLSPTQLKLSPHDYKEFSKRGVQLIEITNENDIPKNADFWYWTRVQKERFKTLHEYEKLKNKYIVTKKMFNTYASKKTTLMHPLPRVGEISEDLDEDKRSLYLQSQIRNGMYIRMALIALVLGRIS